MGSNKIKRNTVIEQLTQMGISNIEFEEPDCIKSFEIEEVDESQLKDIQNIIASNQLKLGKINYYCYDFEEMENHLSNLQLIQRYFTDIFLKLEGTYQLGIKIEKEVMGIDPLGNHSFLREVDDTNLVTQDEFMQIYNRFSNKYWADCETFLLTRREDLSNGEKFVKYLDNITIDNVTQLELEDAIKIKQEGKCKEIYVCNGENSYKYDIDMYILILNKLHEMTDDIDMDLSDEKKFGGIYNRVCRSIEYDQAAGYPNGEIEREYSYRVKETCRNLQGGLVEGKAVCAGYAEILRNALWMSGIECIYMCGDVLKENEKNIPQQERHAWNKVKINGEWFNVDATWDRENLIYGEQPKYALKSDEHIKKHDKKMNFNGPECSRSATQEELDTIFPTEQIKEITEFFDSYPQYQKYASTQLGKEIIELMINNGENDAEILNWDENIIENGTSIDLIKEEIYRLNPSWREYKKTEVGIAVMRLIEAGEDEQSLLEYDDNPYFEENGISISKIQEEIHRQNRKREQDNKKGKNPIEDVGASKIMLSSVKEVTSQIRNNLTVSKEKENARE